MTTEEFYAQALIAALPIALRGHQPEAKPQIAQEAHAYAAALTDIFKLNHGTYYSQWSSFWPSSSVSGLFVFLADGS
jgi:hypothetical protein